MFILKDVHFINHHSILNQLALSVLTLLLTCITMKKIPVKYPIKESERQTCSVNKTKLECSFLIALTKKGCVCVCEKVYLFPLLIFS